MKGGNYASQNQEAFSSQAVLFVLPDVQAEAQDRSAQLAPDGQDRLAARNAWRSQAGAGPGRERGVRYAEGSEQDVEALRVQLEREGQIPLPFFER